MENPGSEDENIIKDRINIFRLKKNSVTLELNI